MMKIIKQKYFYRQEIIAKIKEKIDFKVSKLEENFIITQCLNQSPIPIKT